VLLFDEGEGEGEGGGGGGGTTELVQTPVCKFHPFAVSQRTQTVELLQVTQCGSVQIIGGGGVRAQLKSG